MKDTSRYSSAMRKQVPINSSGYIRKQVPFVNERKGMIPNIHDYLTIFSWNGFSDYPKWAFI
jgi:hypothetical protein